MARRLSNSLDSGRLAGQYLHYRHHFALRAKSSHLPCRNRGAGNSAMVRRAAVGKHQVYNHCDCHGHNVGPSHISLPTITNFTMAVHLKLTAGRHAVYKQLSTKTQLSTTTILLQFARWSRMSLISLCWIALAKKSASTMHWVRRSSGVPQLRSPMVP